MIRAGLLDRTITIERSTTTVDTYGAPQETWTTLATVRAQLIQASAQEFMRGYGASSETTVIFKIRYIDGLTLADRVTYNSRPHDLKQITEIGRRVALELRCLAVGPT